MSDDQKIPTGSKPRKMLGKGFWVAVVVVILLFAGAFYYISTKPVTVVEAPPGVGAGKAQVPDVGARHEPGDKTAGSGIAPISAGSGATQDTKAGDVAAPKIGGSARSVQGGKAVSEFTKKPRTTSISTVKIPKALTVLFAFNADSVPDEKIRWIKERLRKRARSARIVIAAGHTDWTGPERYNLGLSQRRAGFVANILRTMPQFRSANITSFGHGETEPARSNRTLFGRAQNRRCDIYMQ
jgi:outer membrane protein OmpA-like peptidoglycan-associated protein